MSDLPGPKSLLEDPAPTAHPDGGPKGHASDATERPLFLDPARAANAEYVTDPDAVPDFAAVDEAELLPEPDRPLKPRHRELARLHALGKTNNQICEKLGYSVSRVSILIHTPAIQAEVDRYRNKLFEVDLMSAVKELGTDAVGVVEEMLRSKSEKLKDRAETAKWLIEKLTGKARQQMDVESHSLAAFMDMLHTMQAQGTALAPIDVTPNGEMGSNEVRETPAKQIGTAGSTESKFDSWVDTELV